VSRIPTPTLDTATGATAGISCQIKKAPAVAMRRRVLAAIVISFFAFTATTLAAEVRTADQNAVATASKSVPAGRQAIPAQPTDPLAINSKVSAAVVHQLYKELMEWNPPWCPPATNDASLRGAC
jgi:hypothetical protein